MDVASVFLELYGRIPPIARGAVDGLDPERLVEPPAPGRNPIAWLVWHLARIQDHHLSEVMGEEQLWVTGDWARRFGLEPDPSNTGYGHGPEDVASVRPESPSTLLAYLDAVHQRSCAWMEGLGAGDLDRIVDRRWNPPVSLGMRLVSVAGDGLQHAGQAAYLRGLLGP